MMKPRSVSILIIDDSHSFVLRMTRLLADLASVDTVQAASNYDEAIRLLDRWVPDMILLDINLPGKSGISLLKKIKERQNSPEVILVSNNAESYYRDRCIRLGAYDFIDKTAEFDRVPLIVADIIENNRYNLS